MLVSSHARPVVVREDAGQQGKRVGETMMYAYKDQVCVPWWPLACRMQGRLLDMVARDMVAPPNMVAPEGRQPRAPRRKGVAELHGVARLVGQTLLSHWSDAHGAAHAVWAGQRGRARGAHLQHLWPAHESVGWTRGVQLHRPGQVGACPLVGVCCCLLSRQASALPLLHTSTSSGDTRMCQRPESQDARLAPSVPRACAHVQCMRD